MTNARRNQDRHFEVVAVDTNTILCTEKCRDSLGGFNNLMKRLADRFGTELRSADKGETWQAGNLVVRFHEVQTF